MTKSKKLVPSKQGEVLVIKKLNKKTTETTAKAPRIVAKKATVLTLVKTKTKSKSANPAGLVKKPTTAKKTIFEIPDEDILVTLEEKFKALDEAKKKQKSLVSSKKSQLDVTDETVKYKLFNIAPIKFTNGALRKSQLIAKLTGVTLICLGLVTSLYLSTTIFKSSEQLSQVIASESIFSTTSLLGIVSPDSLPVIDCYNAANFLNPVCANTNRKPLATYRVSGDKSQLKGVNLISIDVAHASLVTLLIQNKFTNQNFTIGNMQPTLTGSWDLPLNTNLYSDDTYVLRAYIQNSYGMYESKDITPIKIQNSLVPINTLPGNVTSATESSSVTSSSSSSTTASSTAGMSLSSAKSSSSVSVANTQTVSGIKSNVAKSSTSFKFEIKTPGAQSVKIYAQLLNPTQNFSFDGGAINTTTDTWIFEWILSSKYPNGEYKIMAVPTIEGISGAPLSMYVSKLPQVLATTTEITASTTLLIPVLKPEIRINVPTDKPISLSTNVQIFVTDAKKVEVYYQQKNALIKKYLGTARKITTDRWTYDIETTQIPNGNYYLVASVTNIYGTYEKISDLFQVDNIVTTNMTKEQVAVVKSVTEVAKEINRTPQNSTAATDSSSATKNSTTTPTIKNNFDLPKSVNVQSIETKTLIEERTGAKITADTDHDGILDYDEIAIYGTNPYNADTDGDGFTDGAEILSGHDPLDARSESLVEFESPKEKGEVRSDIMAVTGIATALPEEVATTTPGENIPKATPKAIISGTGLPNSFVTIYIFSTPVVVTLKTDSEGTWTYRFDKEIEDGQHQVYVGITDNAGKIVAKSKPFSFIKVAEAYTADPANNEFDQVSTPVESKSLLSNYIIYLILSISVVGIGLLLVFLGAHIETRRKRNFIDGTIPQVTL